MFFFAETFIYKQIYTFIFLNSTLHGKWGFFYNKSFPPVALKQGLCGVRFNRYLLTHTSLMQTSHKLENIDFHFVFGSFRNKPLTFADLPRVTSQVILSHRGFGRVVKGY